MNETEDVRSAAAGALAEIGGEQKEEAKTFLKKALNNSKTPDPVRINVALAVSKFDLNSALSALTKMYDKDPKIGAVDSPAVALVYIGQEKPDRVVESLQQLSKKYKNTGRQKRSMETDKIIEYIKNPSLNIYFDPRGGCCDGTKESRDAFIKEAKKRLSSSRTKQKR
jgi:HEAT repeat protein